MTPDRGHDVAVLQCAVQWQVVLASGEVTPQQARDFDAWLYADPSHQRVWQSLCGGLEQALSAWRRNPAQTPRSDLICDALQRSQQRRLALRRGLLVMGLTAGAGWLARDRYPISQLTADRSTGTAERRSLTLADGSELLLNARSAVDLRFDAGQRRVTLLRGEVVLRVAARAGAAALELYSREGLLRSDGGTLLARQRPGRTLAAALDQPVQVAPAHAAPVTLPAGSAAWFDRAGLIAAVSADAAGLAAWQHGRLEAHDQPLADIVEALRDYWPGMLSLSARAAGLRVYGVYALDEPRRTLAALGQTLPIRLLPRLGGRWMHIDAA